MDYFNICIVSPVLKNNSVVAAETLVCTLQNQIAVLWFLQLGTPGVRTPRALCTAKHWVHEERLGWWAQGIPNGTAQGRVHADTARDALAPWLGGDSPARDWAEDTLGAQREGLGQDKRPAPFPTARDSQRSAPLPLA